MWLRMLSFQLRQTRSDVVKREPEVRIYSPFSIEKSGAGFLGGGAGSRNGVEESKRRGEAIGGLIGAGLI